MDSPDSLPLLPFELIEPILLTRLAALAHAQHVPDNLMISGRITDPSSDEMHRQANLKLHAQVVACLCAALPSRAMCASAARMQSLDVVSACKHGHIARLDKLHALGQCTDPYGQALEYAIANNHVCVLEWWTCLALPIAARIRFRMPVETALESGAFDTAKWVADHRIAELRHLSLDALEHPIRHGRVDVVHAWLDWPEAELLGSFDYVLAAASKMGCMDVCKCIQTEHAIAFREAVQDGYMLERVLIDASTLGSARVVHWWISAGLAHGMTALVERVAGKCLHAASGAGHVEVLHVWKRSRVPLEYTNLAMDLASTKGHVCVLDWWRTAGLELKYSEDAVTGAANEEHYHVLEWWRDSGLPLKIDLAAVLIPALECSTADQVKFLDWWLASGLPLSPIPAGAMDSSLERGDAAVLGWWDRVIERERGRLRVGDLYSGRGVLHAIMNSAQGSLDWLCRHRQDPNMLAADMEIACKKGVCAQVVDLYTRVGRSDQRPCHALKCSELF